MNSLVPELTKECEREDCTIKEHSLPLDRETSWSPVYDKSGRRIDDGNPNLTKRRFVCLICNAQWTTSDQYGETTITTDLHPNDAQKVVG